MSMGFAIKAYLGDVFYACPLSYEKGTCEIFLSACIIPLLNKNSLKPHQLNECRNDCGDKQENLLGMT